MTKKEAPLLIYDDDCGFCLKWVERWKKKTGERVAYLPLQDVQDGFQGLSRRELEHAVHLVENGNVSRGAEAVFRVLRYGGSSFGFVLYRYVPGFAWMSEWVYDFIARHRSTSCRLR